MTQDRGKLSALETESGKTHKKACRRPAGQMASTVSIRAAASHSAPSDAGGLTPSTRPGLFESARYNHRHAAARRTSFKKATTQARAIGRCAEPSRAGGRLRPTQTWGRQATNTRAAESNPAVPEPRAIEQAQRPATLELPLTVLWARWRQAEPRHDGGSAAGAAAQLHRPTSKEKLPRGWERGKGEGDPK